MTCRHRHIKPVIDFTEPAVKQTVAQCVDCSMTFTKQQAAATLGLQITRTHTIHACAIDDAPTPPRGTAPRWTIH